MPAATPLAVALPAVPLASISSTVLDGSLWLAIPLAVLAGLVSFASPCVLPLVPGYLGYMAGLAGGTQPTAGGQNRRGDNQTNSPDPHGTGASATAALFSTGTAGVNRVNTGVASSWSPTRRTLTGIALFILGFTAVFLTLSVLLAQVGAAPWLKGQAWVNIVLGVLVIIMGAVFMGKLPFLQAEKRLHARPMRTSAGLWGAPILGVTFGLGWAPCIGPTFAAVQTLVFTGGEATGKAVVLTLAYCLGLGVPFLLVAYFAGRGVNATGWASTHSRGIQVTGAVVLMLIGVLIATGVWNQLIAWVQAALPAYELPI